MQPLDKPVALRSAHLGCPVLNPLQLQEQLAGMMVRAPAELAPVVRQDGIDPCLMGLKERQHRFVEHMDRGDWQLAGVEPSLGVAAVAVHYSLQVHLANTLSLLIKNVSTVTSSSV